MKKRWKKVALLAGVIAVMLIGLGLSACNKEVKYEVDCGTLTFKDISMTVGKKVKLDPIFSKESYEITYSFEGNNVEIGDGYVTALKAGETEVQAKTQYHDVKFKVTVSAEDIGSMTVTVPPLFEGQTEKLVVKFSNPAYAEEVNDSNYLYDSDAIEIKDGYVTALRGGETVNVDVRTASFVTTLEVKTLIDAGLKIADTTAWIGYPATAFFPEFDGEEEEITYSYDESKIAIDAQAHTITALAEGEVTVVAVSEHAATSFQVTSEKINTGSARFSDPTGLKAYMPGRKLAWENDGTDGKTTIFIGDSFFTPEFWANFYDMYQGKDALILGVGGSTSYMWELWMDEYFKGINPKNIVMNMGTNNLFNTIYSETSDSAADGLQRMFTLMHEKFPSTNIYYFQITLRGETNAADKINPTNEKMKTWCEKTGYVTFVPVEVTIEMLRSDNLHPKVETYSVYKEALEKTDIEIEDLAFDDLSMTYNALTKYNDQGSTHERRLYYEGDTLKDNFIVSGKVDITTNMRKDWDSPWVGFGMNTTERRIMLSYDEASTSFYLTVEGDKTNVPRADRYKIAAGQSITLEWKAVVQDGTMLFYLNGELKLVLKGLSAGEFFLAQSVTECCFYDFDVLSKEKDEAGFAEEIQKYQDVFFEYINETGNLRV